MELKECTAATFSMVVQWTYTGLVNPPHGQPETIAKELDNLIDFLVLADRIDLLGTFEGFVKTIRSYIIKNRSILKGEHIQLGFSLPKGHPLRKTLIDACMAPFAFYMTGLYQKQNLLRFDFEKEMNELDEFAADLLKGFVVWNRESCSSKARNRLDLPTGTYFTISW